MESPRLKEGGSRPLALRLRSSRHVALLRRQSVPSRPGPGLVFYNAP
jgi:hypothetical protein